MTDPAQNLSQRKIGRLGAFLIVVWMAALVGLFALIMIPKGSGINNLLPPPVQMAREKALSWFNSPTVQWDAK